MTLDFSTIPTELFIHNEWTQGTGDEVLRVTNPATNEVLASVTTASQQDIDNVMSCAQAGFAEWSQYSAQDRAKVLLKVAELLREYNMPLAQLESRNTGKPIQESSVVDIISGAECFEFFAACATHLNGQTFPDSQALVYTRREPLGVVASIGAWNYPLQIACWKTAPALACGNSVVFKPSELTPLTVQYLAEIFKIAGLPPGVFNIVHGSGDVGEMLTSHPAVSKVSLTGSVPTGRAVLRNAAEQLTPVSLELGGKSPLIVFDKANIDQAVTGALLANFYTQGEVCSNGTRVFVQEAIYDEFVSTFVARAEKIVLGDPLDPETQMGPLISAPHAQRVREYIKQGVDSGATLACGDAADPNTSADNTTSEKASSNNFVRPTIFTDCTDDMRITQEEIFGPVACVLPFKTEAEVIKRANDTPFGLAAGVFTQDITQAHRVVAQLQAGVCWINHYNITPIAMPFGGMKASGIGRENGLAALDQYTQIKSVYVGMGEIESNY